MSKKELKFEFMLKEYEMLYSTRFEMHYNAVEKTIGFYFLLVAALVSANGFLIGDESPFEMFGLNEFQIACAIFIFVVGSVVTFKVIEHRLLIITYVKALNQNRKWFNENIMDNELERFSVFDLSYKSPKYFLKHRHFYWEVLGISILNSAFIALFLINLGKKVGMTSPYHAIINWGFFLTLTVILAFIPMRYYKRRAEKEELKLVNKFEGRSN